MDGFIDLRIEGTGPMSTYIIIYVGIVFATSSTSCYLISARREVCYIFQCAVTGGNVTVPI